MSIENLRSQIETFRARTNDLSKKDGNATSDDYRTLILSLNDIATVATQELNRSRAEIETERQSYRNLFRFAEEGYFVTDQKGLILEANNVGSILLGVAENELIGKALSSYIRSQDQPEFHKHVASLTKLKKFHKWETTFIRGSKQEVYATLTASIIFDHQGHMSGLRWLVRDITQGRELEAKLRRNTGQLIESQQIGHIGSWEWDIEHNQLTGSDEMYRIYGLDPQSVKLTYENFLAFIHPEDQTQARMVIEGSLKTHQPFSFEHRIIQPNGETKHLLAHGIVLVNEKNKPVRLVGVGQDVTERKLTEEKLRNMNLQLESMIASRTQELSNTNEQLKNSLAERNHKEEAIQELNRELNRRVNELQTVLDVLPIGVTVAHDPASSHFTINSTGQQMLRVPQSKYSLPTERPFKVMRDNADIPVEDRPMLYAILNNVVVRDVEMDFIRDDGTVLNLLVYASPLYDEQSQVRGGVAAYVDITERKIVERRLALQHAVWRALSESTEINEASLKLLQAIGEQMGWEFGAFWHYDRDANMLNLENTWQKADVLASELVEASKNLSPASGETLPGRVYVTGKPLWLSDFIDQADFPRKEAAIKSGFKSVVELPLHKEGNEVLGVMEFFSHYTQPATLELKQLFDALSSQIGQYLGSKHNEALFEARMRQQAAVTKLSNQALLSDNLEELFIEICTCIGEVLSVEFCNILEVEAIREKQKLRFRTGVGWEQSRTGTYLDLEPGSQAYYVLSENQPIRIIELKNESRFQPAPILAEHKIISGMSVIIAGRSQPFGLLEVYSTKHRSFTHDDLHFLQAVAHVLAAAIQHHELENAMRLSRNQLSVILGGIVDGITAQARNGQLIYVNDAAAHLNGYENAEEMMTTPVDQITSKYKIFDENGMPIAASQLPGRLAMQGEVPPPMMVRFKVLKTGEERWSLVKAQPVTNAAGEVMMVVNIFHDISDLKRDELRQRLLAEASRVMAKDIDYATRLNNLAYLLVPSLADWVAIDLLDGNKKLQRVVVAHPNPQMVEWAHELHQRYPPDPNAPGGVYEVIRTNQTQYIPIVTEEMIEAIEDPERRELTRKLKLASAIVVPLYARGHTLGVLSLVWAESDHYYRTEDVALTEELARRTALALDNALLYAESQRLNAELEDRVIKRAAQLQRTNIRLNNEIKERQLAEDKYRQLNAELEEHITERTAQLEDANQKLKREIFERLVADDALRSSLQKTRELYEISQTIGLVNTPEELLQALLSSSYLESTIRASIAVFDRVWQKDDAPPASCKILTDWNRQSDALLYIGQEMSLSEYGLIEPFSRYDPLVFADIRHDSRVSERMRQRLLNMGVVSSAIFPLVGSGEWYGLLSLHFDQKIVLNTDDIRHLEGLVDELAMGIYNFRLLEAEARARHEAEEANNMKMKFLAMISHELRTPLTSIKGFSTTLLADDVEWLPENQRDFIETISSEADKLTELIEQLLNLSRLEAGSIRISPRTVEWSKIVATSLAQLKVLTVHHRLVMEEPESDFPILNVDEMRISQVITNLVNNAVKYSPQNTTITITAHKLSDQFIKVCVTDEGMGIPSEARTRVFEAFQQLDREKAGTQGAGLGLAICRGLIEAHGGRIWVDDHTGSGTMMSFTLPIADDAKKVTISKS